MREKDEFAKRNSVSTVYCVNNSRFLTFNTLAQYPANSGTPEMDKLTSRDKY